MGKLALGPAALSLAEIEAAAVSIAPFVRATPCWRPAGSTLGPLAGLDILCKLENLQVAGSFKARGATNKVRAIAGAGSAPGLVAASGGNHGIAIAYAGRAVGLPTIVVVPSSVDPRKAERIRSFGAELMIEGDYFDGANELALRLAAERGLAYVHPFADRAVIAGQGTVGLEIATQAPDFDTILIAIGGGGLIAGVASALAHLRPGVRIVGVEPEGCPTMKVALDAGRVVAVESITTKVPTLAARTTGELNFTIAQALAERIVLVRDEDLRRAARFLWGELAIGADLAGASAVAALLSGAYRPDKDERLCVLICGAGSDGMSA